ncbi:MAG: MarR family transcriptional regulator [Candidatus Peribacteraceae bacterium]|jgi:MarR family transcriptional repressor of emrRAB
MTKEAEKIIAATFQVSRLLRRKIAQAENGVKSINMLQLYALSYIKERYKATMKEFADHMQVSPPSATSFIDRLVKMGLVKRLPSRTNRKIVQLKLTPLGNSTLTKTLQQEKHIFRPIVEALSRNDQQHMLRILQSILQQKHS